MISSHEDQPTARREWTYFLTFAAVGASGMIVDVVTFLLALSLFPPSAARAVAIWVAMTWNFGGNRTFTFRGHRRDDFWSQYVGYCLSCLVGAVVNWSISVAAWSYVPGLSSTPWLPPLLGVAGGTGFNYVLCRWWVFRTTPGPASRKPNHEESVIPAPHLMIHVSSSSTTRQGGLVDSYVR